MTDYEKAKAECWKELYDCCDKYGEITMKAFDYTFESAYRYGRLVGMEQAKTQSISSTYKFGNSEQLRAQAAIAAMQGLLSSPIDANFNVGKQPDDIAVYAMDCADALLAELDKI